MRKFALLALVTSLTFSSFPVVYASERQNVSSIEQSISEDMLAMNNIGLIVGDKGGLTAQFAQKKVTGNDLHAILLKLGISLDGKYKELMAHLAHSKPISEKEFYEIFLQLLGYEKGVDFNEETVITFADAIGLAPTHSKSFTHQDLARVLNNCLKSKTKEGHEYFEILLADGFLNDYNTNKDIPEALVFDGKTQPIFKHDEAIYEKVYVEVETDTDFDGKLDLVEVWIKRPAETEKGMQVPVVFELSPYERGTNDDLYDLHNVDEDLTVSERTETTLGDVTYKPEEKELPAPRKIAGQAEHGQLEKFDFDGWYDYFFARGYAVVSAGGLGSIGSEGIVDTGSADEIAAGVAIINWLNGDARAFTNKTDNIEVKADWSTGNVGMSGRSYRGTLPIGIAATGVDGLKTIVPVAAISSWYDYYRTNGLNLAGEGWQGDDTDLLAIYCMSRMFDPEDYSSVKAVFERAMDQMRMEQDRVTGDYNVFWDERNYLNNADQIKASVFIVHGLNDWNVKSKQFDMLWKALEENDVPRKMVLHQGEHISINNLAGIDFNDMMNRWFDYWLYEIDNNVMEDIAPVTIQNNTNLEFETFDNWPVKGETLKLYLNNGGQIHALTTNPSSKSEKESFVDNLSISGYDRAVQDGLAWRQTIVGTPEEARADRLAYVTEPLKEDMRISGTINVTLKAALDQPTGIISAMLVDYGTEYRPTIDTEVVVPNGIIYGGNAGSDDIVDFVMESEPSTFKVISRGWMDAQNRVAPYRVDPIKPGTEYTFTVDMQPMDYTVKAGHKLGLILYSTDAEYTMRPLTTTHFTVNVAETFLEIPVAK